MFYLIKIPMNEKKTTTYQEKKRMVNIFNLFSPCIFLPFVSSELSWCIKGVNDDNELTFTAPFFLKSPKGHYKQI